jgi:hypothetical protein
MKRRRHGETHDTSAPADIQVMEDARAREGTSEIQRMIISRAVTGLDVR